MDPLMEELTLCRRYTTLTQRLRQQAKNSARAGGTRIALPSALPPPKRCERRCRVIHSGHLAIDDNHNLLEVNNYGHWSFLAGVYRDMLLMGKESRFEVFPGTAALASSSALSDALVGRRRWTDPEVMAERDLILGPETNRQINWIHWYRQEAIEKVIRGFQHVKRAEREAFGLNSYFYKLEKHATDIPSADSLV